MSYGGYNSNPYGQDARGGNPYAQPSANPYGQQSSNPYAQQGGYGGGRQDQAQYGGRQPYGGNDVEMVPMNGQGGYGQDPGSQMQPAGYGQPAGRDPNAILNECREIDQGIDTVHRNIDRVRLLQQQSLNDTNVGQDSHVNRELEKINADTMTLYRNFVARLRNIKSQPESGSPKNFAQVGRVDRRLKSAIQDYQVVESDFRKQIKAQLERQYRIVNPGATDAEVKAAAEQDTSNQVFSQALLQSNRRGEAQTTLASVASRHAAIQQLEKSLIELAQLFQDLDVQVVQQEPAVAQIEQKGEQVTENVNKATHEMGGAVEKARSRNRKKWWCLLIVLLIIIVIVIIVVIVTVVRKRA